MEQTLNYLTLNSRCFLGAGGYQRRLHCPDEVESLGCLVVVTKMNLDDDKFYSAIINVKVDGKALPRETTNWYME